MSIYREEAIDILISCLRDSTSPTAQIAAAEAIIALPGRFSASGKSLTRSLLLKRGGIDKNLRAMMQREQRFLVEGALMDNLVSVLYPAMLIKPSSYMFRKLCVCRNYVLIY